MKIHRKSHFKDTSEDHQYFQHWVSRLENLNQRKYEQYSVITSLGKTVVWGLDTLENYPDTLVIFPAPGRLRLSGILTKDWITSITE